MSSDFDKKQSALLRFPSPGLMGVLAKNRPASYHVNHRCIGCCICSAISPRNFRSNHERGLDYVYKQPDGPEEERLCAEAMEICPVDAIDKHPYRPSASKNAVENLDA